MTFLDENGAYFKKFKKIRSNIGEKNMT